jgi:sugar/nucleoside kinase (ribokinase family)
MKLLIIGHSVEDHICSGTEEIIKAGGIYYTVLGLVNYTLPGDEIFLATYVEKNNYHLFSDAYDKLKKDYIKETDSIPKVFLTIHPDKEREEKYDSLTDEIIIDGINLNRFDGIYINMVTGFDVSLRQLKRIRKKYNGLIYMDIHTLSRGFDKNMKREFRLIDERMEWLGLIDIVQVNNSELFTISDKKNEEDAALQILSSNVKILIITKESAGSKIFTLKNKEILSTFIPSEKIICTNKIGCGDVFGGIFFYNYLASNKDELTALKLANIAGALTASKTNSKDFINFRNDILSRHT